MSVYAIYFSPTKGTEKIVKIVANELGMDQEIDLSKQEVCDQSFDQDDICIFGVPSYGGRVPSIALERMSKLKGNHAKAILVVSYGNRAYDDTLKELEERVKDKGFHCVAAMGAIARHSIMHQFATNRPDEADKVQLIQFTKTIMNKIKNGIIEETLSLPGNNPYREYNGVPLKPKAGKGCVKCAICAKACPVGAIPIEEAQKTNDKLCISCMRCIDVCPNKARKLNPILLKVASKKLEAACQKRKDNEVFV